MMKQRILLGRLEHCALFNDGYMGLQKSFSKGDIFKDFLDFPLNASGRQEAFFH